MKKLVPVALFVALTFYAQPEGAQTEMRRMSPPPASQQTPLVQLPEPAPTPAGPKVDLVEAHRDAVELARTAQSIPIDVESIRKGTMPKDVLQKLKQIEKLSKRLRSELNP
jgi:hypothetical protein